MMGGMQMLRSVAIIMIACMLSGCAAKDGTAKVIVEPDYSRLGPIVASYFPAREADSVPNWGMVRYDGSMLFSNRFESRPSASINGYFTVKEGEGYTVYKASPSPVAVDGLRGLVQAGAMSGGLMPIVRRGGRVEIVDGDGVVRMQLSSINGKEIVRTSPYFIDGVLGVMTQDGLWGAVSATGEMILEPMYDAEPRFSERLAVVSRTVDTADSTGRKPEVNYYLVNNAGKTVLTFPRTVIPAGSMKGGRMPVRKVSGGMAMLDSRGKLIDLPRRVKGVDGYSARYVVWRDASGNRGLFDEEGRELIVPTYRTIHLLDSDRVMTQTFDGVFAIADSAGSNKVKFNGFDSVNYVRYLRGGVVTPFQCVGSGYAGAVLMDSRGHRIGPGPLHALAFETTLLPDGHLHTDFFNAHTAVHEALSHLTAKGWGRAALGMKMCGLIDSLNPKHTSVSEIMYERQTPYMLAVEATAKSDRPIASDSLAASGKRVVWADTAAVVRYIKVDVAAEGGRFSDMLYAAGAELVPHGFRVEKRRDSYAVYASHDRVIIIAPRKQLAGMMLYIMDKEFFAEMGERFIADAELLYERSTKKPAQ